LKLLEAQRQTKPVVEKLDEIEEADSKDEEEKEAED
jgi:hypothetical protein